MVIKQAFPTTVAGLVGLNRPAVNALSELLWRYMRIPYGRVQDSGYNACTGKYCIICPGGTKKKKIYIYILYIYIGGVKMLFSMAGNYQTFHLFLGKRKDTGNTVARY
jgi:hypothetical protein